MDSRPQISTVIVNYNAHEFILLTLESLVRAIGNNHTEIIVVDNASTDGSIEQVRRYFPEIIIIQNSHNIGFAAANNIGLRQVKGEFVLLLNPDTMIAEDTFTTLLNFMTKTADAGAVGCKIINPDGSYSRDSRHSIPSPLTALWKQLGFQYLFPGSKVFGQYNLTYLDPDKTYSLDAISGSFMFLRRRAIEQVGFFDEDYFMYCEDIDYCYRLNRAGWKVYYCPDTVILHFKGESTPRKTIHSSWNFSHSLYLFYKKHFRYKYGSIMSVIVLLGVLLRIPLLYLKHAGRNIFRRIRAGVIRYRGKRAIWVGSGSNFSKSQDFLSSAGYKIMGILRSEEIDEKDAPSEIAMLDTVEELKKFIAMTRTDEIIYSAENLSFKFILQNIVDLQQWKLHNKILLARLKVLVGKSV